MRMGGRTWQLSGAGHAFLFEHLDLAHVAICGADVGFQLGEECFELAGRHVLVRRWRRGEGAGEGKCGREQARMLLVCS